MNHEEVAFTEGMRILGLGLLQIWERNGIEGVQKELKESFSDQTLKHFPENLTRENLIPTLMGLKQDNVVYRENPPGKGI